MAGAEVCRKIGISEATYYNWKKKYGGLGVAELRGLHQMEAGRRSGTKPSVKTASSRPKPGQTNASGCDQKKALTGPPERASSAKKIGLKFNGKLSGFGSSCMLCYTVPSILLAV